MSSTAEPTNCPGCVGSYSLSIDVGTGRIRRGTWPDHPPDDPADRHSSPASHPAEPNTDAFQSDRPVGETRADSAAARGCRRPRRGQSPHYTQTEQGQAQGLRHRQEQDIRMGVQQRTGTRSVELS